MNTKHALAVGIGFALGAAAIQGLHAQTKPPAYYIGEITVKDQEGFIKQFAAPGVKPVQKGGRQIHCTRQQAGILTRRVHPRASLLFNSTTWRKRKHGGTRRPTRICRPSAINMRLSDPFSSKAFRHKPECSARLHEVNKIAVTKIGEREG